MTLRSKNKIKETNSSVPVKIFLTIFSVLIFLYCLSLLIPLIWMLFTAVKDDISYNVNVFGFPKSIHFENFAKALSGLNVRTKTNKGIVEFNVVNMLLNSIVLSVATPAWSIILTAVCAYVLSRYKFKGNAVIYTIGIIVMITPIVGNFSSAMMVKRALKIYDNPLLIILTSPACAFSGMNFLILYAAFKGIPMDFSESAEIDGAGHFIIMLKIIMPIALPTMFTLFVLGFIGSWNDYATCLVWLPSFPNLPYGMYLFQMNATGGGDGASTPVIMAGFFVVMIPSMVLYLCSQKLINSNMTVGGLKG